MTIELISQDTYKELCDIQAKYPILTFQNKGYEGVNRGLLTDEEKQADKRVNEILNSSIKGFSVFQNFNLSIKNEVRIRFQYDYGADQDSISFTGVGYLFLDELLKGFRQKVS